VLGKRLGVAPERVPLRREAGGRPVVEGAPDLRWSLSHCATHAAVAVADGADVGVDVEDVRDAVEAQDIADRFFARSEAEALRARSRDDVPAAFTRLWTCKEAFVKAIGLGLTYPFDRFTVAVAADGSARLAAIEPRYGSPEDWSLHAIALSATCRLAVAAHRPGAELVVVGPGGAVRHDSRKA
jgi:4'-phosphopantetheinyl transferase